MITYGQEGGGDASASAGAGGAGGAGDAAAVLEAVSGIITGVGQVVYLGRMTESQVYTNVADYQDYFQNNLQDLNNIKKHIRKYKRWLADKSNLASWCDTGTALNHAPKGSKSCVPLYEGKPSRPNPGGHRCGSPACQCKTHSCAYRDPLKADSYQKYIEWAPGPGGGAGWSNPPNRTGRGAEWRLGYLREAWNYLMTVAPAQALWNMQNPDARISVGVTMLTTPEVLETLFPELGGKMPLSMQDHWWGTILSLNALRLPPYTTPEATVPPFVFGFTDAEVRELIPSENQRKAVFSIRFLVSLQREYTRRLLAAAGATDVFAGVSYGQDPLEPPVGAEDMRELIVAASDVPNPVTKQGTPSANVKKQLDTVRQARIRSAGAVSPEIKRFQRMDNTELALAAQKSMLAAGILRTREKALQDSLDDAIEPNYTPLVAGTAAVVAALFLRRRLN